MAINNVGGDQISCHHITKEETIIMDGDSKIKDDITKEETIMDGDSMEKKKEDYESKIKDDITEEETIMDGESIQKKKEDYESKIKEYEREMEGYKERIYHLKGDLCEIDHEIRKVKFRLMQVFPELKEQGLHTDPYIELQRIPGYLDKDIFTLACLEECRKQPCNNIDQERRRESEALARANSLHKEWRAKVRDPNWGFYLTWPGLEEDELLVKIESGEVVDIKKKYGADDLYFAIKNAWLDFQESQRTNVQLKPWNLEAGREYTLDELLVPLLETNNP